MCCTLNPKTHENLIQHLVNIEDAKTQLIDNYFPGVSVQRTEAIEMLDNYIAQLDSLLQQVQVAENADPQFPMVVVGSRVTVRDMDTQETFTLRITPPFQDKFDSDDVSILSPVGKALLTKKVGDIVHIKTPGGAICYLVESINL